MAGHECITASPMYARLFWGIFRNFSVAVIPLPDGAPTVAFQ